MNQVFNFFFGAFVNNRVNDHSPILKPAVQHRGLEQRQVDRRKILNDINYQISKDMKRDKKYQDMIRYQHYFNRMKHRWGWV